MPLIFAPTGFTRLMHAEGEPSVGRVASRMGIAPETAKQYIDRVRKKYRDAGRTAGNKIDLLRRAIEDGLIDPSGNADPQS